MTTDSGAPRSRRALLVGGLAAGAAAVASTIASPLGVSASNGQTVAVGGTFTGTTATTINVGANNVAAIEGISSHFVGVLGSGDLGIGVRGTSIGGAGVRGDSVVSVGVLGTATSGLGVWGQSTSTGIGVKAGSFGGVALRVEGKASFSRSGRATIAKGNASVDITVAGGLAANSVVHATLQTYRGNVSIAAVRTNYPSAGKARIYLTKVASTTGPTIVAWFVAEY